MSTTALAAAGATVCSVLSDTVQLLAVVALVATALHTITEAPS